MIRRNAGVVLLGVLGVAFVFDHAVNAWQNAAIVALERGAMDRWGKGDPGGYLDLYASDATYFDPSQERRIVEQIRCLITETGREPVERDGRLHAGGRPVATRPQPLLVHQAGSQGSVALSPASDARSCR